MKQGKEPLELYIHIPFCIKKCEYCDFLSGPSTYELRKSYVNALCREMESAEHTFQAGSISTVFIGGGTPSVLEVELMDQLFQTLHTSFHLSEKTEFTIEANPGTLTREKLMLYKKYGVNRLSLGLQSTFEDDLKILGRIHDFHDFEMSFQMARETGFQNINVDLISAIPGQTRARWEENIRKVASFLPEHISAYSLIVEEGTPFYEKDLELPDEETEYQIYEDTRLLLAEYGYHQYEISNYARDEKECRHNIGYWKRADYLGIGLGASSLVNHVRFTNTSDMNEYLNSSDQLMKIRKELHELTLREEMEEYMFLGLRLTNGVSETEFLQMFHCNMKDIYGEILEKYRESGHLLKDGDYWRFSYEGIHVSNWILADFLS